MVSEEALWDLSVSDGRWKGITHGEAVFAETRTPPDTLSRTCLPGHWNHLQDRKTVSMMRDNSAQSQGQKREEGHTLCFVGSFDLLLAWLVALSGWGREAPASDPTGAAGAQLSTSEEKHLPSPWFRLPVSPRKYLLVLCEDTSCTFFSESPGRPCTFLCYPGFHGADQRLVASSLQHDQSPPGWCVCR